MRTEIGAPWGFRITTRVFARPDTPPRIASVKAVTFPRTVMLPARLKSREKQQAGASRTVSLFR